MPGPPGVFGTFPVSAKYCRYATWPVSSGTWKVGVMSAQARQFRKATRAHTSAAVGILRTTLMA
jgi:hypothetical protein